MTKSLENNDFLKGFGRSSCFQTLLKRESVYKHEKWTNPLKIIIFSRDLVVFLFLNTYESKKCLETEKQPNPLKKSLSVQKQGNDKIPWIWKVSGNRKITKFFASAKTSLTRGTDRPFRCSDYDVFDINDTKTVFGCLFSLLQHGKDITRKMAIGKLSSKLFSHFSFSEFSFYSTFEIFSFSLFLIPSFLSFKIQFHV